MASTLENNRVDTLEGLVARLRADELSLDEFADLFWESAFEAEHEESDVWQTVMHALSEPADDPAFVRSAVLAAVHSVVVPREATGAIISISFGVSQPLPLPYPLA